ncbi:CPBP family glutamic-type intramembrane protease [Spirillospora sp. CA-128828]|uniref:CPBP family glutamic-type intramembrane protease n=1 Tax=Spirillospora sp. CA-128828 TaxID=3240033 RepID=UPI003D8CDA56
MDLNLGRGSSPDGGRLRGRVVHIHASRGPKPDHKRISVTAASDKARELQQITHRPNPRMRTMTQSLMLRGTATVMVLFGAHFAIALNDATESAGADIDWPGLPAPINVPALSLTAAGVWLLIRARRSPGSAVWCAAGLALSGAVLLPLLGETADTTATLLLTGAGAWLCAQIAADAGAPLWKGRLPCEIARRWDKKAVAACAVVLAGHTLSLAVDHWVTKLGPAVTDQAEQADATGLHNPVMFAAQALAAGVREEIPLLALPAALMVAARRPVWQILLVVCVLRAVPHAYLGTAALSSTVFATTALWMYQTTRRVGPIIAGHMLFNAIAMFGGPIGGAVLMASPAVAGFMLDNLPEATPRWLRTRLRDKHARSDHTIKVKEPLL